MFGGKAAARSPGRESNGVRAGAGSPARWWEWVRRLVRVAFATGTLVTLTAGPVLAQTTWNGSNSNNWATPANWSSGAPGAATNVLINSTPANVATVSAAGAQAADVRLATSAGQTGTLVVTGAGSTLSMGNPAGLFLVGQFGTGNLTVSAGGVLNTYTTSLGDDVGGVGIATVTGAGSIWNVTPIFAFHIGSSSTGTLNIESGGRVNSSSTADIGGAGGTGTINVIGANSLYN
jgi:T5SS/PEP-CTERM-associated repeat protein